MNPARRVEALLLLLVLLEKAGEYYYDTENVKRWVLGPGGKAGNCEICVENADMGWIPDDDTFLEGGGGDIDGPPAHPNAVLERSTFRSYGVLRRMVSAKYAAESAIFLVAGEYRTTIGPNHPMLTLNGLVPAKFLKIGDQLVCDLRPLDESVIVPGASSNFNQVIRVEDCFSSLCASFGYSCITASGHDFHGDVVDQEIKAVFPQGRLLLEVDPTGLEFLGKIPLVLSDSHAQALAGSSAFQEKLSGLLLSTAGSVSGGNVEHYCLRTVEATTVVPFKGLAFDATTEIGLYCSDGFVVSNCECTLEYKEKRVRVYV